MFFIVIYPFYVPVESYLMGNYSFKKCYYITQLHLLDPISINLSFMKNFYR